MSVNGAVWILEQNSVVYGRAILYCYVYHFFYFY